MKNLASKIRKVDNPYEIWANGAWTWKVLKKYQADDTKPYGRWFCFVTSPYCPDGEYGDVYVTSIKEEFGARLASIDQEYADAKMQQLTNGGK